ncbi:hypothetical protein EGI22_19835 [Lacihabitans sp. LS3-19]|uniref:hypothetical protein n=1 Tax=Lacihabitans sp. LS3-19 TaxID=2487335 RepID=UPI0020CB93E4|nr:hypothetical protein [Lacihabitans sp. LS3-19]MCP9770162.1 hypothetical protein [Lacihabitans sp. LS3-19]
MKKLILLLLVAHFSFSQSVEILPGNNANGNILSNSSSNPSLNIFKSGTGNPDKMVISHSPTYTDWGLQYKDVEDKFVFIGEGLPVLTTSLSSGNVGVGTINPSHKLDIFGGNWNLATSTAGDFRIGDPTYNFRIGVATGGGGAGDVRMYTFGGTNRFIWGTNALDRMALNNAGDLGIGTITPEAKVHIDHTGSDLDPHIRVNALGSLSRINWTSSANSNKWIAQSYLNGATSADNYWRIEYNGVEKFNIKGDGDIGINTNNPTARLHVVGPDNDGITAGIKISSPGQTMLLDGNEIDALVGNLNLNYNTTQHVILAYGGGNVGIGTTSPNNKLDVLGIIRANEVIVETGWADYVFEEDYKLDKLENVENFIKENKHLPNVPSAKDIEEKGAHVAELMTKMMAKIEELTLHTIRQQKEIEELKKTINKN